MLIEQSINKHKNKDYTQHHKSPHPAGNQNVYNMSTHVCEKTIMMIDWWGKCRLTITNRIIRDARQRCGLLWHGVWVYITF